MALAGFSVGEAEGLRRAMSRKRSEAALEAYRKRFVEGALANGVAEKLANEIYDKLVGFSGFGFPKSHAAAFGLLAYQSQWLRCHYPAEFLAALLNEQPMGFYPPATLVRDAQRRGVEVLPPDVNLSDAKCVVQDGKVRIGIEYVTSIGDDEAKALVEEREANGLFRSIRELVQRTRLRREGLEALISSGACSAFGDEARPLLWEAGLAPRSASVPGSGGEARQLALPLDPTVETPDLPEPTEWERMLTDYRTTSLTVGIHPLELLRPHLSGTVLSSRDLCLAPDRSQVAVAGMAIARQRPATANGVVFMLLEDEFGQMNLIVPPQVYERHRAIVRGEPRSSRGRFEKAERNQNVLVRELETLGPLARKVAEVPEPAVQRPAGTPFRAPLIRIRGCARGRFPLPSVRVVPAEPGCERKRMKLTIRAVTPSSSAQTLPMFTAAFSRAGWAP